MIERSAVTDWLLDSDPALRWQVERDLLGAPEGVWEATRSRVGREGFGARLLALQDADGQWAGGAFFPRAAGAQGDGGAQGDAGAQGGAGFQGDAGAQGGAGSQGAGAAEDAGQPWTATTWVLNTLRDWGLVASALEGTSERLAANSQWEYGHLPYWGGEVDCCINGYTLANGAWLGADVSGIAEWFLEHQMDDGGWNCEWVNGSVRSSFHSTLNALRGILCFESATGGTEPLRAARKAGEEYLLERRLLRRLSTGELVGPWATTFAYPFRWQYTALRAADYFRAAALHDDVAPDPRLAEAIGVVRGARQPDGTWLQGSVLPGRVWFEIDVPTGLPSKWLTFYGARVLDWWDRSLPGC